MTILTVLQKAAINRSLECAENLHLNIGDKGKCELEGAEYDYASLKLVELKHWLREVLNDSEQGGSHA